MKSICFVSFYSGPFPDYFPFFLESCRRNPTVDFVIFSDADVVAKQSGNVRIARLSRGEFEQLVEEKLGFKVEITRGLKIAEFRPALGFLFEDVLRDYDFWGYCDVDQIFGDIRKFVGDALLEDCDVVTTTRRWVAGHFALFRNEEKLNKLFMRSPNYREVFQDSSRNWHFEESGLRWDGIERCIDELAAKGQFVSIYDLVRNGQREGSLKAHFGGNIREHSATSTINYLHNHATLTDLGNGEEFLYHHLVTVKNFWWFYVPRWEQIPAVYHITDHGMRTEAEMKLPGSLFWRARWGWNFFRAFARAVRRRLGI
jgi:hypothetical protein